MWSQAAVAVIKFGGAAVIVALGTVLAVLARDGACLESLPPICTRRFGVTSWLCISLGITLATAWAALLRRQPRKGQAAPTDSTTSNTGPRYK